MSDSAISARGNALKGLSQLDNMSTGTAYYGLQETPYYGEHGTAITQPTNIFWTSSGESTYFNAADIVREKYKSVT